MPTLLYNLELTQDELLHLWVFMSMQTLMPRGCNEDEESILKKVEELLEVEGL